MTQLNTPYPATAYLTGFLRAHGYTALHGHSVTQADPALELVLELFSINGLSQIASRLKSSHARGEASEFFLSHELEIKTAMPAVLRFLQGRDPSLAQRISGGDFLPKGPRAHAALAGFAAVMDGDASGESALSWAFGALGTQDRAKYLASLLIDDLADAIREAIDPRFELSRYGEKLAASQPTFDPLLAALAAPPTLIDQTLDRWVKRLIEEQRPDILGLTVPFPGNVYGALRIARVARALDPKIKILLGGGYVNTELRSLKDPRFFDYFDYVIMDDGERPLLCVLEHLQGLRPLDRLKRTFVRRSVDRGSQVELIDGALEHDIPHRDTGTPTYDGLKLDRYLSLFEMLNPMHRIWSDGRWNKLTLAHGCYWKKCNFCDVNLDYIGRYDAQPADQIVDQMEALIAETGQSGFHFVDEAAPPALLRALSERLIARGVTATWWGNVRFEKSFTPELAELMARAGCIAISGGLEVASDRLLKLMNKGVTVEQVARVTHNLTGAGILVHAYLMYGFPTQTEAETIDALERVRQLFDQGCIQSAYWHRFSATVHSPIGRDPGKFGIQLSPMRPVRFAQNDLDFKDPTPVDHDRLGCGLKRALYNYMHGIGLEQPVHRWFEGKAPEATVRPDLVARAIHSLTLEHVGS